MYFFDFRFKVFLSTSSGKILLKELEIDSSGVYEVYVIELVNSWWVKHFVVATQSSVHMIWLLPQYLLISIGEVMFSVNGMTFAFSQVNPTSEQSSSAWIGFESYFLLSFFEQSYFCWIVFENINILLRDALKTVKFKMNQY